MTSLYVLLPIILWPLTVVFFTKISRKVGFLSLSFFRQLGIFIVGLPLLIIFPIPNQMFLNYWSEIFIATLTGAIYIFLTFLGFNYLPVGYSRIFTTISRVFISIGIGFFLLGETLSNLQIIGLIFILLGVILLKPSTIDVSHLDKKNQILGIGISILAGIIFSISLYYFKIYSSNINPIIAAYSIEVGCGFFLGLILFFSSINKLKTSFKFPLKYFLRILLLSPLVLLGTFGSTKALETMPFSIVNILYVFILVFSIIFGWIFLKEKLTKKEIMIFGLMIIGLVLIKI